MRKLEQIHNIIEQNGGYRFFLFATTFYLLLIVAALIWFMVIL